MQKTAAAVLGLIVSMSAGQALAQQEAPEAFPSRNITMLVPFPPGGPPDVIARVLAAPMGEALGKAIIVENRPGASTSLASQAVARAAPDGYTIMATDMSMAVVPHILAKPGFDPLKDFRHIGRTALTVLTIVVTPGLPVTTAKELVALSKAKPGDVKIAHTGIGTPPHLGAVAFIQATGAELLQVPYRGAALAIGDVVGGHVTMLATAPSTSIQLTKDGKVRMLGVTGAKRLAALPEIPTLKEAGYNLTSLDEGIWFGMSAPAGTPDAIIAKLNAAMNAATKDPKAIATLAQLDVSMVGGPPGDFDKLIREQFVLWRDVMKAAGVKPE
jgi:tripartite-type tricarboxylate transporter receptor subunit TctC